MSRARAILDGWADLRSGTRAAPVLPDFLKEPAGLFGEELDALKAGTVHYLLHQYTVAIEPAREEAAEEIAYGPKDVHGGGRAWVADIHEELAHHGALPVRLGIEPAGGAFEVGPRLKQMEPRDAGIAEKATIDAARNALRKVLRLEDEFPGDVETGDEGLKLPAIGGREVDPLGSIFEDAAEDRPYGRSSDPGVGSGRIAERVGSTLLPADAHIQANWPRPH